MSPARTTVGLAVAATVLAVVALVMQAAGAPQAARTGPAARGGPDGRSRPAARSAAARHRARSWQLTVGGPALASRGIVVHYPARGARRLPRVPASAYVVADAGTGKVLAA
jgi:D-alanyl-D-alanine carboxypeptidase (penicillin-binding protein 5/6)